MLSIIFRLVIILISMLIFGSCAPLNPYNDKLVQHSLIKHYPEISYKKVNHKRIIYQLTDSTKKISYYQYMGVFGWKKLNVYDAQ